MLNDVTIGEIYRLQLEQTKSLTSIEAQMKLINGSVGKHELRLTWLERAVYGGIAAVLTAVLGGVLTMVIRP